MNENTRFFLCDKPPLLFPILIEKFIEYFIQLQEFFTLAFDFAFLYIIPMLKIVMKFGGSSLATPERIANVIEIINKKAKKHRNRIGVVVSAFGGVTDELIQLSQLASDHQKNYLQLFDRFQKRHLDVVKRLIAQENQKSVLAQTQTLLEELRDTLHGVYLVKELSPKTKDFILSFGERLSALIISEVKKNCGLPCEYCDARALIKTDDRFGNARVYWDLTEKTIQDYCKELKTIPVIPGFIGSTLDNETTTLGRGGSDYTASIVGAALHVDEIEIWTDVNGVMTADPRMVKKAFSIPSLSYEEAMELSHFGAKVIYPPSIQPAMEKKIPLRILNSFQPDFEGTVIGKKLPSPYQIRGISSIHEVAMVLVEGGGMFGAVGFAGRLFNTLAKNQINVILISQASSEHSICFAVDPYQAKRTKKIIEEEFKTEFETKKLEPVVIDSHAAIIAVVGENMRHTPGIAGRLFQALGKNGINVLAIAQGSSELNISVVISRHDVAKALNVLHDAFFLSGTKTIHLFLLGTGLIGSTLLKQLHTQYPVLVKENGLDIQLIGLGNIDAMVFHEEGISFDQWENALATGEPMDIQKFVHQMKKMNLPNSIFVDCTGSANIVAHYEEILNASISIVTPSKIANAGPYSLYQRLHNAATRHGVKFLYETNVGAGLPVINTLNDLIASGDTVLKIEAVLSGTLSYIFNSFSKRTPFSEIVRQACQMGLTEPDPRDDLSGLDVARKLLILAREAGHAFEFKDITLEPVVPEAMEKKGSVEEFIKKLENYDSIFEKRYEEAERKNCLLRYVAILENGKAEVGLREVSKDHPFSSLSGSDNMIVFTTERYRERPLVVKGPGAGAEVTAAGVFADILRIANFLA